MNGSKHVFADNALVKYDSVLVVVTLPRYVSYQQVASESEFSVFSSVSFSKDVALLYPLSLVAYRTEVYCHILVGTAELRYPVLLECRFEAYELLFLSPVVKYSYGSCVYIFNNTVTFGRNHCARVNANLAFDAGSYNRSFVVKQRYRLTHHVTTHQRTVGVVVLQERNQAGCD